MNYKSLTTETPQFTIFNRKSFDSNSSECSDFDPEIFHFIEKSFSQNNSAEIIKILEEFEIVSKYISRQYIQEFGQTKVPSQLVELLISPNPTISYYASRVICSLITTNAPEYAEDFCKNSSEIFHYIEKVLSLNNTTEIIKILKEFEIASKFMSYQYIQTFGQTKVPSQLVELLISPNPTISYYASRVICSLITTNAPEYAEDLCQSNFLLQCANIFNKKSNDSSLIYVILISLSNLATFSRAECDLIFSYISVDTLAYYAQSQILDDSSYDELLRLLVILSYNNNNDEITFKLIELTQSIFSDLINDSKQRRYRILQLAFLFSKYTQFFSFFINDHSTTKLLEILVGSKKSRKELYFLIPILTNSLLYFNDDFHQELFEICDLISTISKNDHILNEDLRIIRLSSKFIQAYIKKNPGIDKDLAKQIINMLISIKDKYGLKEKREILFCIFDLLLIISEDTLFDIIYQDHIFETIVDVIEAEDNKMNNFVLEKLTTLFQKYEEASHFLLIKQEFINAGGIDSLVALISESNDKTQQLSEMAEALLQRYLSDE